MSMGRRRRQGWEEEDAYSQWGRRHYSWGGGVLAAVKRRTHKRERAEGKR